MTKNDIKLIELPKFERIESVVLNVIIDNLEEKRRRKYNGYNITNK